MNQSRAHSMLEAVTNTAVGYILAVLIQLVVFPALGLRVALHDTLTIGAIFTAASVLRSYLLRRAFDALRRTGKD